MNTIHNKDYFYKTRLEIKFRFDPETLTKTVKLFIAAI